jgi:hypothetical protein
MISEVDTRSEIFSNLSCSLTNIDRDYVKGHFSFLKHQLEMKYRDACNMVL